MSKNSINIISSKRGLFSINFKEIWQYRDLLTLFVKRDFISVYKQTVLGPTWFVIQPILTTFIYTVIFGGIAGIGTDGIPKFLFYLAGITCWGYFSECFLKTSNVFVTNTELFGKVYFPRMIAPLSIVVSNLLKFTVQFILFIVAYCYYYLTGTNVHFNWVLTMVPILILLTALMGIGLGMVISSLTTKYKDLRFLIAFGVQLVMYTTPIIYPFSLIKNKLGEYYWLAYFNPITPIIESFKYAFFGKGTLDLAGLTFSAIFAIVVMIVGTVIFNKVEKSFMDTV
ncbi:MAG: ABC transporter permease [Flavobacteriales bacterium]|nr:ABC transporter permease [Flavobacteriales bacterium]|tara:strand:- start:3219 stop:4070 length:852 start_codon:yes stop_codon:yes gene_type:complete